MNRRYSALAVSALALGAAALATPQSSASPPEPDSAHETAQVQSDDWPDEGSGYPGYGAMSTAGQAGVSDCPGEGTGHPAGWWVGSPGTEATCPEYNYPNYDPQYEVAPVEAALGQSPSDGYGTEALRAGASALGGAGFAFGGMWLYRRRHAPAI